MILTAALLIAQEPMQSATSARFEALERCVQGKAVAWSMGPDTAKDIAAAAVTSCSAEERALRDDVLGEVPIDGSSTDRTKYQARERILEGALQGIERRAVAAVIEARAKRPGRP